MEGVARIVAAPQQALPSEWPAVFFPDTISETIAVAPHRNLELDGAFAGPRKLAISFDIPLTSDQWPE